MVKCAFPIGSNFKERTYNFKNQTDKNYHIGQTIHTRISDLCLISAVPPKTTYMHLVLLGVVKKMFDRKLDFRTIS